MFRLLEIFFSGENEPASKPLIFVFTFEFIPVITGKWPVTSLLGILALPSGLALVKLLTNYHDRPELIHESKFLALRFQAFNGLGLSVGLAMARLFT